MKSIYTLVLAMSLLIGCKKCPTTDEDAFPSGFTFFLLHKDTSLPLCTQDTSIAVYPPLSVYIVTPWGEALRHGNDSPYGFYFGSVAGGGNGISVFYIHFLTTGDVDTLKVKTTYYMPDECTQAVRFEYWYNSQSVPIDSSRHRRLGPYLSTFDSITLYKKP